MKKSKSSSRLLLFLEIIIVVLLIGFALFRYTSIFDTWVNGDKIISLTFDIHETENIDDIIDIIEAENVHATFFFTSEWLEKFRPDNQEYFSKLKKLIDNGTIEVGNLSDTYTPLSETEEFQVSERINKGTISIESAFQKTPKYFRPPQGISNSIISEVAKIHNQKLIMWDIDSLDTDKNKSEVEILQRLEENTIPNKVIIFHDNKKTIEVLPYAIEQFKKQDFSFLTLSELQDNSYAGISDFQNDYMGHWSSYANQPGILRAKLYPELGYMRVDYYADPPAWGAIYERIDTIKRDWSGKEGLEMELFGYNTNRKYRVILVDDERERWGIDFEDTWEGWRTFNIPFSHFKSLPAGEGVTYDGKMGLTHMQEIHFVPTQGIASMLIRKIEVK